MDEKTYLKATNRVKISAALNIIRDVLPGEDFGISDAERSKIISGLQTLEENLFASFTLDPESPIIKEDIMKKHSSIKVGEEREKELLVLLKERHNPKGVKICLSCEGMSAGYLSRCRACGSPRLRVFGYKRE